MFQTDRTVIPENQTYLIYVDDLKLLRDTQLGPTDFYETASILFCSAEPIHSTADWGYAARFGRLSLQDTTVQYAVREDLWDPGQGDFYSG